MTGRKSKAKENDEQYLWRVGLTTQSQRILRAEFSLVVLYREHGGNDEP